MPLYRFTARMPDNTVASSCILRASTEEEAREIGHNLLADNEFHIIEVWSGPVLICRAEKTVA